MCDLEKNVLFEEDWQPFSIDWKQKDSTENMWFHSVDPVRINVEEIL